MKVYAGHSYIFNPVLMDQLWVEHHTARKGQRVVVVNLPGAPKCNTMGQCHIEDAATGEFLGMVCVNSLEKV